MTDLITMLNSLSGIGTYYDNGDGRVRAEISQDMVQSQKLKIMVLKLKSLLLSLKKYLEKNYLNFKLNY